MAVAARWQLHPLHLDLVHNYLGLDDLTAPLRASSYGAATQQVGEVAQREADTMRTLGTLQGDEVAPQLVEALTALCKPSLRVSSLWFPNRAAGRCAVPQPS